MFFCFVLFLYYYSCASSSITRTGGVEISKRSAIVKCSRLGVLSVGSVFVVSGVCLVCDGEGGVGGALSRLLRIVFCGEHGADLVCCVLWIMSFVCFVLFFLLVTRVKPSSSSPVGVASKVFLGCVVVGLVLVLAWCCVVCWCVVLCVVLVVSAFLTLFAYVCFFCGHWFGQCVSSPHDQHCCLRPGTVTRML